MHLFDLHCDTLYRSVMENKGLLKNDFQISLQKGKKFDSWVECFAIWISFDLTGEISEKTQLLLQSMLLGIEHIAEEYGKKYVQIINR